MSSATNGYLFVSCMGDQSTFSSGKGSIYVLDINDHSIVKTIYTGYQPRGITVNDLDNVVYVANRNADPQGADAPHHYTGCDGNNGYVTIIDMNTLELIEGFKTETSVDPFSIASR